MRPIFDKWSMRLRIDFDADQLTAMDVRNILNTAGWVGLGAPPHLRSELGTFRIREFRDD